MKIILISPVFPAEMPLFTAALAEQGAEVIGVGETPPEHLPDSVRRCLSGYIPVRSLWDEDEVVKTVAASSAAARADRVECLWEPGVLLAAKLRERLGVPGMSLEHSQLFRDKEAMKQVLDRAGLRTPRHRSARTESEIYEAAEELGYPLILKPVSGAGSADTYRVDEFTELPSAVERMRHVEVVSVEEFIIGEELTYDTVCANAEVLFENVSWYRPQALIARTESWVSPQTISLRDLHRMELAPGIEMGRKVLQALEFRDGFTHMEWFRTKSGEAVFIEIACRPPGARSVDVMGQATNRSLFQTWAEATVAGRLSSPVKRPYNAAVIFKRASGDGRIHRVDGVAEMVREFGPAVVDVELLPVGAPRRNWKQTLLSDGFITLRHPDLDTLLRMADRVGNEIRLFAEH